MVVNYYVDINGNKYVDINGNYYTLTSYDKAPTKLNYLQYKSQVYNNGYKKVKPYINTKIEVAIAGLAIPGISRVSS